MTAIWSHRASSGCDKPKGFNSYMGQNVKTRGPRRFFEQMASRPRLTIVQKVSVYPLFGQRSQNYMLYMERSTMLFIGKSYQAPWI